MTVHYFSIFFEVIGNENQKGVNTQIKHVSVFDWPNLDKQANITKHAKDVELVSLTECLRV